MFIQKTLSKADPYGVEFELGKSADEVTIKVCGELDHHSVKRIREIIDERLIETRPKKVVMDLAGVDFTDSAGLGMILGRYTRITDYGGVLSLEGVSEDFMKILKLAGTERLVKIKLRERGA